MRLSMRNTQRRGAAAVEFAVCLPLLVTILLGILEMGRLMMVEEILVNCARDGARTAAVTSFADSSGNLDQTAVSAITNRVISNLTGSTVNVTAGDSPTPVVVAGVDGANSSAKSLQTLAQGDYVQVTTTVPFSKVAWITPRWITDGTNLSATVAMWREIQ
jgi:Flp pilus assembly protein TadG